MSLSGRPAGVNRRRRPTALLIDCDGVLRHFNPAWPDEVERRHGLAGGALMATAFERDRLVPAITGQISHAEWMAGVGEALGAPAAVTEWATYRGDVVPAVADMIRDVRATGIPVGLATNATDRLDADLAELGLSDAFDAVVNSSVVGVAKPHPDYYVAGCKALGVAATDCLFLDDSSRFVAGARAAGLMAQRFTGEADVRYVRAAFGV